MGTLSYFIERKPYLSKEGTPKRTARDYYSFTALANGEQPEGLHFDQPQMQKHLMHCLKAQCLSAFPLTRKRAAKQAGSTMIQCIVHVKNGSMLVFVWMYPVKYLTLPPNGL